MIELSLVIALAAAGAAVTVAKSRMFQPLRDVCASWASDWLFYLVTCPYCLAHWLVFLLCAVYRPRLIHVAGLLDYVVTALAIITVAAGLAAVVKCGYQWTIDEE